MIFSYLAGFPAFLYFGLQVQAENLEQQEQLEENVRQKKDTDAKVNELLDILDDVCDSC